MIDNGTTGQLNSTIAEVFLPKIGHIYEHNYNWTFPPQLEENRRLLRYDFPGYLWPSHNTDIGTFLPSTNGLKPWALVYCGSLETLFFNPFLALFVVLGCFKGVPLYTAASILLGFSA